MDMPISPGGIHAHIYTRNVPMHTSVESGYLLYLQNQEKENKVISGYMPISPGAPHTLPVGFLAVPDVYTSSSTCSLWWCAGGGPAPQTG